jgi:hypothetical protein
MKFIEKLNTPVAVAVVFAIFLTVDGFLFYRFQERSLPSEEDAGAADMAESATSENEGEATDEPRPPGCYATELSYQDVVSEKVSYRPFANRNPSPNAFFVQPLGGS